MNKNLILAYTMASYVEKMREEDIRMLDGVNIAFGKVNADHSVDVSHITDLSCLKEFKRINPNFKATISLGGWRAGGFSEAAYTDFGRKRLTSTTIDFVKQWDLDGIDLDWEFPCYHEGGINARREDRFTFTLLIIEMRRQLDALSAITGKKYTLSIAAGNGPYFTDAVEITAFIDYLDYVQIMSYDHRGSYQTLTGHHSNLFINTGDIYRLSTHSLVETYLKAGVPREKLLIGAAFYTRHWFGVPARNHGMNMIAETVGDYGPTYTELAKNYINKNGYVRYWDDEAKAPWLFNGDHFISYDDEESIHHKMHYVREQGLLGLMFWEYSCDETGALVRACYDGLYHDKL